MPKFKVGKDDMLKNQQKSSYHVDVEPFNVSFAG
jgi:hypothetical protein